MGKREKKQGRRQRNTREFYLSDEQHQDGHIDYSSSYSINENKNDNDNNENDNQENENEQEMLEEITKDLSLDSQFPSKFHLYQQSVQSPKGDISYLQKFFLMYVGGRQPLHLQEDFCGTALLSTEWLLRSDPRRTAVGLDLDVDALDWCLVNNIDKIGADGFSRISLFHGNVLQPLESKQVSEESTGFPRDTMLNGTEDASEIGIPEGCSATVGKQMKDIVLPGRDIVCAFNYSCCCLHKRSELVLYFKSVLNVLSKRGGIFVMDLYGGVSSEKKLRLQRRFPNFTYVWEQAEFDIVGRKTRISLHFHLQKQQKKLRHAFSYSWRLWSLPEIKDCLEEAGFSSVHFWLRQMPDTEDMKSTVGFGASRDVKYEEVTSFQQEDAWNAYIVGVSR